MSEWPLPSKSASELAKLGDAVVPQLVAALASDATFTSYDPNPTPDLYGGPVDIDYYAAVVAAEALQRMPSAAPVALPALLATWRKTRETAIRRACHDAILELCEHVPADACRDVLARLVRDPDSEARYRLIRAASRLGTRGLDATLALARDSSATNREAALASLGGSDDPRVTPLVHELAQRDPMPGVRYVAMRVLVKRARELALPLLVASVSRHSGPATFDDLATFDAAARDAIPQLTELLPHAHPYKPQLANALRALIPHARPEHVAPARRALALALDQAVRSHRERAELTALTAALAATPAGADDATAARLIATLRSHRDDVFALGRAAAHLGATAPLHDVLIELLEDASEFTRADAATLLGELGAPRAIPALEAMMARDIKDDHVHGGAWKRAHEAVSRLRARTSR